MGSPVNAARVASSINPYSSKVIVIKIGRHKVPFSIHKAKLEALTSFFEIHGAAINLPNNVTSTPPSDADPSPLFVSQSDGDDVKMKSEDGGPLAGDGDDNTPGPKADYEIVDRFHTVGAFKIFTGWLYNDPPKVPKNKTQCKNLLQAYVLARQYNAYELQNLVVDRFREHHSDFNCDFDNLVWLANRIGDSTETCALTAYFVEQVAWEITDRGFEEVDTINKFFDTFLKEGKWAIRLELVKSLAKHAQASRGKLGDPAKSVAHSWHVEVFGEDAGRLKDGATMGFQDRSRRGGS